MPIRACAGRREVLMHQSGEQIQPHKTGVQKSESGRAIQYLKAYGACLKVCAPISRSSANSSNNNILLSFQLLFPLHRDSFMSPDGRCFRLCSLRKRRKKYPGSDCRMERSNLISPYCLILFDPTIAKPESGEENQSTIFNLASV